MFGASASQRVMCTHDSRIFAEKILQKSFPPPKNCMKKIWEHEVLRREGGESFGNNTGIYKKK